MTQRVVNYTYGTGNPVLPDGSIDVRDGIDNLQSFDIFMNADEDTYNQRDGEIVKTRAGAVRAVGFKPASFTFVTGGTLGVVDADKCIYNPAPSGDDNWYSWGGNLPHTVAPGIDPTEVGSGYVPRTDLVLREHLSGNWAEGGGELSVNITEPFGAGDYRLKWQKSRAALRGGLRDPLPLDDGKDHFRGLPNKDAWADPAMQGIGSFATGRNGASFAYLSATFGHDCVVYGAAGLAGGAGSCAGNPDIPFDDGAFGYCSLAYGKNTLAMGRISNAMGQDCEARSLVSSVDGYASYAAPGLASHPNAYFPGAVDKGVVSEGKSARAYGWRCEAYGDHATSIGFNLKVYNSATAIGSSPDDATPATISVPGAVAFFAQSTIPGVVVIPEDGTKAKTGFNTVIPRERFESVINPGEKFAVRKTGVTGNGRFALQGTLINDTAVDILSIEWNSPSTTVANGIAVVSINGIPSIEITETGVVNFLVGSLSINQNGQGVKLKSPNGLTTKILRLSNAGALELV